MQRQSDRPVVFLATIFLGGCILAAADKGFGVFMMVVAAGLAFLWASA